MIRCKEEPVYAILLFTEHCLRFDMYTGDGKAQTGSSHGTQHDIPIESNQIIEVLELANGNTVWYVCFDLIPRLQ